jgi:hypothetical protein
MLIVNWGVSDFHVVDLITSQSSFDSQYFVSNVMTPVIANIYPQGRILHARQLHFHLDNCAPIFQTSQNNSWLKIRFCVCHTHLTAPILHLHISGSSAMWKILWPVGRTFDEPEQFLEAITEFLDEIHPSELEIVFSDWIQRVRWVLENNQNYYH